ncbi:peptidogalycan biosysnthesis protein [Amycolatopsis sp. NPDC058340]|uniref:peptidogalycan biosysnthesis protein n=1 Tax=Amycolatopsis sp. NPDC058340 TaxID=3346453 RepID=UPI003661E4D2
MTWTVGIATSVHEFGPHEWDVLADPAGCYAGWSWTAFAEAETGRRCAYVFARDGRGLAAVLPLWFTTADEHEFRTPSLLLGDLGVTGVRYAVMGFQKSYRSGVLTRDGIDSRSVIPELTAAANRHAAEHRASGVLALYADTSTMLRLTGAVGMRRAVLLDGCAGIEVPADGLEGYLDRFSHQRRGQIRREMRKFAGAGYEVGVESLTSCLREFAPLAAQLESRHGMGGDAEEMLASLTRQAKAGDEHTSVFTARRDGALAAACLSYHSRPDLLVRMFGKDYDRPDKAEYFNLLVYEPLRYAITHGFDWVELGHSTAAAKVARGAIFRALWAVDLSDRPLWTEQRGRAHTASRFELLTAEATKLRSVAPASLWSDLSPELAESVGLSSR